MILSSEILRAHKLIIIRRSQQRLFQGITCIHAAPPDVVDELSEEER